MSTVDHLVRARLYAFAALLFAALVLGELQKHTDTDPTEATP